MFNQQSRSSCSITGRDWTAWLTFLCLQICLWNLGFAWKLKKRELQRGNTRLLLLMFIYSLRLEHQSAAAVFSQSRFDCKNVKPPSTIDTGCCVVSTVLLTGVPTCGLIMSPLLVILVEFFDCFSQAAQLQKVTKVSHPFYNNCARTLQILHVRHLIEITSERGYCRKPFFWVIFEPLFFVRPVNKKSFLQHVEDLCANDNSKFQEEFAVSVWPFYQILSSF